MLSLFYDIITLNAHTLNTRIKFVFTDSNSEL